MRVLKDHDYGLLERLVALTQQELHKTLSVYLKSQYTTVITKKDYTVAIGDIPIALVAHMDTVFSHPASEVFYDQRKGVLWSPDGLGADDRAGIFAILQIVKSGLRPSIILTTDEERGGLGAQELAKQKCPIPNLKYMIQLDRHGTNDCVFYDCFCPEFTAYIESFGFTERIGSFSDISFLMPAWDICGVNLSVGYENEHSLCEVLYINALLDTIDKVKKILTVENIPDFEYDELVNALQGYNRVEYETDMLGTPCCKCEKYFFDFELIPVKGHSVKKMKYYCSDCVVNNVNWCDNCGFAYEIGDPEEDIDLCSDCMQEVLTSAKNN